MLGLHVGLGVQSQIQRAISLLRRFGSNAHLWLPGGDVRTYGPELVTNGGPFTATTGWSALNSTIDVVSQELRITNGTSSYGIAHQSFTTVVGGRYVVTGTARVGTTTAIGLYFGTGIASFANLQVFLNSATNAQFSYTFTATASTTYLSLINQSNTTGHTSFINFISVREITSITSVIQNGLTTGNYLESTGNTLLTVDNPAGLVLDALGTVGSELVPATALTSTIGWLGSNATVAVVGSELEITSLGSGFAFADISIGATSKLMKLLAACRMGASGGTSVTVGVANAIGHSYIPANTLQSTVTSYAVYDKPNGATSIRVLLNATGAGQKGYFSLISVREVSGIHCQQATTANKGVLRLTSGRYNWVFDATDLLTGTFPAGYESVTVIDAKSTGQVTTAAANIVGSYSIGPSYTSYGRIVVKGSLTASELTLLQGFANKLAGL